MAWLLHYVFFEMLYIMLLIDINYNICVCQRLAEDCASDPALKENSFTAPSKHTTAQDSLETLCQCLLHCCDTVWIPAVIVRADVFSHTQTHTYIHTHKHSLIYLILSLCLIYFLFLKRNTCKQTLQKKILPYVSSLFQEMGHCDCNAQSRSSSK